MRIAYFDCFAGVTGEMLLGALLGAGLSLDELQTTLSGLDLPCYELGAQMVVRKELPGTYLSIVSKDGACDGKGNGMHGSEGDAEVVRQEDRDHAQAGRSCPRTLSPGQIIGRGRLPNLIRETSLAIFRRLAQAEAAVSHQHGRVTVGAQPVEEIVSVVGVVAGLSLLGISRVECSPIHVGSGVLCSAEGMRPALSPVAVELLRTASVPVYGSYIAGELVSPVGVAIITTIASAFGAVPAMKIDAVGYGAGKHDLEETPSLARVFIGEAEYTNGHVRATQDPSHDKPDASPRGSIPDIARLEDAPAAAAPAPSGTNTLITNHQDWTALVSNGHQQSGRQRRAS